MAGEHGARWKDRALCDHDGVTILEARLARGLSAAGLSTVVALAFHLAAGGPTPAAPGVIIPFILATIACLALTGWGLNAGRLAASVGVSQLLFHTLFVLGTPPQAPVQSHVHGTGPIVGIADAPAAHTTHLSAAMGVAHIAAALLTIVALAQGEQAVIRLITGLASFARTVVGVLPKQPTETTPLLRSRQANATPFVLTELGRFGATVVPRGPPLPTSA